MSNDEKPREKMSHLIIRISEFDRNRIKYLASKFASGNVSEWVRYGALNVTRKTLKPKSRFPQARK